MMVMKVIIITITITITITIIRIRRRRRTSKVTLAKAATTVFAKLSEAYQITFDINDQSRTNHKPKATESNTDGREKLVC
jgi:Ni/Fe-hydrogenase subunit HybB-like protein